MPSWIIAAAVGSIVITALLTLALWRLNAPALERARQDAVLDRHNAPDEGSSDGAGDDGGE